MYRRILLAYDGTVEGRAALREGALLARQCGAQVYLLSVVGVGSGVLLAESAFAGAVDEQKRAFQAVFDEGVERLSALGFRPTARLVVGDPATEIREFAFEIGADLVIVGHRRKSLLERWWSGQSGAYLLDQINCSLLIGRNNISEEAFYAELTRLPSAPVQTTPPADA